MLPFTKILALLSVTYCVSTAALSADDKKAQAALQAGDYKTAKIEAEASLDTLTSNLVMGMLYENGYGVDADINRAIPYFEKAGELGNFKVLAYLGKLFEDGKKVPADIQRAVQYYELAGKLGATKSYIHLATLYTKGEKLALDYTKVQHYLSLAVEQKNGNAAQFLGSMAETGLGQTIDFEQALAYYQQAIDLGDHAAILEIMRLHTTGYDNITGSIEAGNKILWQAANEGNPSAAKKIAQLFASGTERSINKNAEQAYYWYNASSVFGLMDKEVTEGIKALQADLSSEKMASLRTDVFKLVAQVQKIKRAKAAEQKRIAALDQALAEEKAAIATMDTAPTLAQYSILGYEMEWLQRWGNNSTTNAIIATSDGGLFAFGKSWNPGQKKYYLSALRYNKKGKWLWFKSLDVEEGAEISDAVELYNGDIILSGYISRDDQNGYRMTAWVARLNRNGDIVWQKEFGDGRFSSLAWDGQNIFIGGVRFKIRPNNDRNLHLAHVLKITPDGDQLNSWTFGSGLSNLVKDVALTHNGHLIMVGQYEDQENAEVTMFGTVGTFKGWLLDMAPDGQIVSDIKPGKPEGSDLQSIVIAPMTYANGSVIDTLVAVGRDGEAYTIGEQSWLVSKSLEGSQINQTHFSEDVDITLVNQAPDGTIIAIGTRKYTLDRVEGESDKPNYDAHIIALSGQPFEVRWSQSLNNFKSMTPISISFNSDGSLMIGGRYKDGKENSGAFVAKLKPIMTAK